MAPHLCGPVEAALRVVLALLLFLVLDGHTSSALALSPPAAAGPSTSVLFIGDSIDSNVVKAMCARYSMNLTIPSPDPGSAPIPNPAMNILGWGGIGTSVRHGDNIRTKQPAIFCHLNNTSPPSIIAYLHIFGSFDGPYHYVTTHDDPYVTTTSRIKYALGWWKDNMPPSRAGGAYPDVVTFNTVMWDMRGFYMWGGVKREETQLMAETKAKFKADVLDKLRLIRSIVGQETELTVRTAPQSDVTDSANNPMRYPTGDVCNSYNTALREISLEEGISLWDYSSYCWELAGFNLTRLQEDYYLDHASHPISQVSFQAGEIIMGQRPHYFYTRRKVSVGRSAAKEH